MNYIFRLLRFLARLVFIIFFHLISVFLQFIIFPILGVIVRVLLFLVSMAFTATVNSPGRYIDRLAAEWTRQIIEILGSDEQIDQIYSFCRFLVGSLIVLGWIVSTLFTVAVLRVFFGL